MLLFLFSGCSILPEEGNYQQFARHLYLVLYQISTEKRFFLSSSPAAFVPTSALLRNMACWVFIFQHATALRHASFFFPTVHYVLCFEHLWLPLLPCCCHVVCACVRESIFLSRVRFWVKFHHSYPQPPATAMLSRTQESWCNHYKTTWKPNA